jgi:hypothetical protein
VSALILGAGALVAVDRDDRAMLARLRASQLHGMELRTNAMVVAQVWRDRRGRQVNLARLREPPTSGRSASATAAKLASCS